jgi:hypothetical protein
MHRIIRAAVLASCLAGTTPAQAGDGWHLTFQTGPDKAVSVIDMSGGNFRGSEAGSAQEVIVSQDAFTVLDNGARTYMVITFAQIETTLLPMLKAVKEAGDSQKEHLQDALDQLSPEERAKAEEQLQAADKDPEHSVTLEKTKESSKVAGLEARKMLALQGGKAVAEVWVTNAIPTEPMRRLAGRFMDMASTLIPREETPFLKAWPDLDGFPVRVVDLTGGTPHDLLTLTGAEAKDMPLETFLPPKGYTQSSMGLGGLGGLGGH